MNKTRGVPILMTVEANYSADATVLTIICWLKFSSTSIEVNYSADLATVPAEASFSVETLKIRPKSVGVTTSVVTTSAGSVLVPTEASFSVETLKIRPDVNRSDLHR